MTEGANNRPMALRCARWALDCAVKHWPEESRQWGLALAAEMDEATNPFDALWWSLGGIMFFARSVFSGAWKWLKLPAGSSLPGGAADEPNGPSLLPKRSRLFTAAILAAAALLLIFPRGREAIRTVGATWHGYMESASDVRALNSLADRAEKEKDGDLLAFAALSTIDRARGAALTERAVALDPKLIWVYGARNHGPKEDPPRKDWLARLQAADPGNAVPDLLVADALIQPKLSVLFEHGSLNIAYRRALENDSEWMALMERACAEPRYDSYFQRHYQLTRTVWNREKNIAPTMVLYGIWQHAMPSLLNIRMYSDIKTEQASRARASGDFNRAESLVAGVSAFGMRMAESGGAELEKMIGLAIERKARKEMAILYAAEGKTQEAQALATRLDQIEDRLQQFQFASGPLRSSRAHSFDKQAMLVQSLGSLCLIVACPTFAGILLLELWPKKIQGAKTILRRTACLASDYGPATLLAACGAFLVSFLPFARAFEEYRTSSYTLGDEQALTDAMWSLLRIPEYVVGVDASVQLWSFVTMALSALLLVVLVRGVYRTRRPAQNPA